MNRSVSTERNYSLGNYQSIKFFDSFNGIPERFALDSEIMNTLEVIQLARIALSFRMYLALTESIKPFDADRDKAMEHLENIIKENIEKINAKFEENFKEFEANLTAEIEQTNEEEKGE